MLVWVRHILWLIVHTHSLLLYTFLFSSHSEKVLHWNYYRCMTFQLNSIHFLPVTHTHTTCCYIGFWRQWKFNKTCFAFMALIHCFSTNSNRVHSFFPATIHFSAILVADSFRLIKGIKWINGQMGIHLTR